MYLCIIYWLFVSWVCIVCVIHVVFFNVYDVLLLHNKLLLRDNKDTLTLNY